jgi:MFS family permease
LNSPSESGHDPYAALRFRDFRFLLVGRFIMALGNQMLSFAIGWELWLRTHSELALGLVGLVQIIPVIVLSLPAGHVADQYNRKRIVLISQAFLAVCSLGLAALSFTQGALVLVYLCLLGIGISRAFSDPASSTLLPQTVPPSHFTNAATWNSSAWQLASITGPAVAGFLVAILNPVRLLFVMDGWCALPHAVVNNIAFLYELDAIAAGAFLVLVSLIKGRPLALARKAATLESLSEGIRFIRNTKVILAAITLDMFAVLFGGAVTLLPVFATDILKVGPEGLGLMRAAPSIGALIMTFVLVYLPTFQRAGRTLLLAVTGFGLATIVFGLSTSFWLSVVMLALLGGLDNISVVIRATLLLVRTPDEMRGRISSVNSIFIGASNELGGFESGLTAALFGPMLSVVGGGIGTILVVLAVARIWPEMRALTTLEVKEETGPERPDLTTGTA